MRVFLAVALMVASSGLGCSTSTLPAQAPKAASGEGLTRTELSALRAGDHVERRLSFSHAGRDMFGGVAYVVVDASPERVWSKLAQVEDLGQLLPRTKLVQPAAGYEPSELRLTQGNNWVEASYSLRFDWDPALAADPGAARRVRFWLDKTNPHDIQNLWGYFQVRPLDDQKTLVTMAVALDLGHELIEMLFRSRIEQLIFETPGRLRQALADSEPGPLAQR